MPPQASTMASEVDALYYFIFWVSVFFFVLIAGLSTFFVIRYHRSEGRKRKPRSYHNTPLEITWTLIPLFLVMVVFVWGFQSYMELSIAPAHSLQYHVTAKKWLWEIEHPNGVTTINEMTVPLGKPVKVILKSEDLIHSFFVPAFRVKADAVPNRYTTLWFEAIIPGEYDIFCAEFCGSGHSGMLGKVKVLSEDEWNEWLEGADTDDLPLVELGEQLYTSRACITCHSLDGSRMTGPSFKGVFGHEVQLKDGRTVTADEDYLRKSIIDPGTDVVAGYQPIMPTFSGLLKPREIDALIEFIKKQQ